MIAPEFSRPINVDSLDESGRTLRIEADPAECAALARRFGLVVVDRLAATAHVSRRGEIALAQGRVEGAVTQSCSVTGDPLPAAIDIDFTVRFAPDPAEAGEDERELDADDLDTVLYAGTAIDLGEAAAETLALALDPFPRGPGADAALKQAGVLGEDEVGPFSALKGLRDKLGGSAG